MRALLWLHVAVVFILTALVHAYVRRLRGALVDLERLELADDRPSPAVECALFVARPTRSAASTSSSRRSTSICPRDRAPRSVRVLRRDESSRNLPWRAILTFPTAESSREFIAQYRNYATWRSRLLQACVAERNARGKGGRRPSKGGGTAIGIHVDDVDDPDDPDADDRADAPSDLESAPLVRTASTLAAAEPPSHTTTHAAARRKRTRSEHGNAVSATTPHRRASRSAARRHSHPAPRFAHVRLRHRPLRARSAQQSERVPRFRRRACRGRVLHAARVRRASARSRTSSLGSRACA